MAVRPAVPRWVSLVVLAFAVACMHSLATLEPAHTPAESVAMVIIGAVAIPATDAGCDTDPCQCPGHDHDMTHMCLAVLVALGALIIG